MSNSKTFNGDISNPVFNDGVRELNEAEKRLKEYAKNKTINLNTNAEVKYNTNGQDGFKQVTSSIDKHADAIAKEWEEKDKTIRKFNKDLETLQKNLKKAGTQANAAKTQIQEEITDKGLFNRYTPHKGVAFDQDSQKIDNSKLTDEQKEYLKDLSKEQKKLNTQKEKCLETIQKIQQTENKTEEEIIKQYKAAFKLKKVLDQMEMNKALITDIVKDTYKGNVKKNKDGKEVSYYDWTSKTTIPQDVNDYIKKLKLEEDDGVGSLKKELEKYYRKQIESVKTESEAYKSAKQMAEAEKNNEQNIKNLEKHDANLNQKLASQQQSLSNQMKNLEQDTIQAVENYLKMTGSESNKSYDKLKIALNSIAKYMNTNGNLGSIISSFDDILKNNPDLGKNETGKKRIEELKLALSGGMKQLQELANKYNDKFLELPKLDQTDTNISNLKKQIEGTENELKSNAQLLEQYKQNIYGNAQDANTQAVGLANGTLSGITNNEIPVAVTPSIESPQAFVDEITQQLKGHSAKVDVELNSENVAEEIKKITEMIPDKKEIEVSIKSEQTDKNDNIDVTSTDTKVQKELQEVDKLENDLKAIYQLIDKIELEDIIGENFNTVYAEKDLLNLISLLKEIDKLTGQTSDYSHLTEGYESKYFKPSYFSEFMDGVKPESDEWYDNESVIREAQQLSIISTIGANDVADMYAALLDEIAPTIKSKVEEMFTLDPKALRKHFEDYGGIIRNAIGGDAYYDLEDRLYPDQSDNLKPQNILENISSITESLKEQNVEINVAPNVENPQEFANDVTAQLKGVTAKIDVVPQTDNSYHDNSEAIQREKQALTELSQDVSKVTTAVDEKTRAFHEEEQVVTGTVQREIGELERLAGQLHSVQDDIGKIATTIASLPKIDFDVDLSKLNIENIDGASIASFNAFREQLAGLEAQLNVSNLSSKLVEVSNSFETLSGLKLDNLNTKNLNLTRITNLIKQTEGIEKLVDALMNLEECLERLKNDGSFDKDYFTGLKFSAKNVNNMADMAVALETVAIALRQFDKEAKDALSSINKLVENAEGLKNLNTIISSPKKVKKAQEVIKNEDKSKEPTDAQKRKAETIDRDFVDGKYHDQVEKLTKRYERLNEVIAVSDNRTGDLRQALEDLRNAHTVEDKIKTFEDFKDAIAIVEGELKNLEKTNAGKLFTNDINNQLQGIQEQYKNVPYLSNSLTLLVSKIEQIGNEAKDGSADLTELSKKAEDAFTHFKKGMLPTGDVKGNFDSYDKAVEKARELVASYAKVKTELKVPLQLDDNGIAKMTAQVVDLNEQLKNLTFVYNNASKAMVLQTTDMSPTTAQTNKANTIDDNISNGTYEKELKQVEQRYAKLQDTVDITQGKAKELSEAFKDLKEADTVESKIQALDNYKNALASAKNELTGLEKERSTKSFTDEVNTQLKSIQEQYGNSSYLKNSLISLEAEIERISTSAKKGSADLTNLGKQAKTAFANFQKGVLPSGDFKGTFSGLEDAVEQAKKTVDSYSKVKSELKAPLQVNDNGIAKMTAQVIDFNGQLKNLTFVYNDTTKSMVQQTTNVRTELLGIPGVVDAIKHKLKDMAVYWTATLFDPYDILYSFRQVAEVVIDLNTQMTELAKVSGLSIDRLEKRFSKWANTAKDLGATVSDTISATADWSRLGYSIDEAEKLAEVAILYKNVGDGIDIEAANESLVSTMQGFQLEANQAESVIDSFNEVDLFASCYSNVVACINFT